MKIREGYIKKSEIRQVRSLPYGVYDFETYSLEDGTQRAYYLLIYLPSVGYTHIKRCDYPTEERFKDAILSYFENNKSIYYSFNGANFDHLILNRMLPSPKRVRTVDSRVIFLFGEGIRSWI